MSKRRYRIFALLSVFFCLSSMISQTTASVNGISDQKTPSLLTEDEQQYVNAHPIINIAFMTGSAPIIFSENGEIKGILKNILEEISFQTGFEFRYTEADNRDMLSAMANNQEIDLIGAIPSQYLSEALHNKHRTKPFLISDTTLFMRIGVDASKLSDYVLALISGSQVPEDIDKSKVKFYNCREAVLNAVEKGMADYCYANEFSIAYYSIKNGYKNVMSIPQNKDIHEYFLIYINEDEMLISIIDKAIESLSIIDLQSIILQNASQIERNISWETVMYLYAIQIILIALVIMIILSLLLFLIYQSRKQYKRHTEQHRLLTRISGEYIYEYDVKKDILILSDETVNILNIPKRIEALKKSEFFQKNSELKELIYTGKSGIELSLVLKNGEVEIFRLINSAVRNKKQKPDYIVGKLINISEEKQRLHDLRIKAQIDGLTGLYNSDTTRTLIKQACESSSDTNALFIIDIDKFKDINDSYGHPMGDKVLTEIALSLKKCFRDIDIVGRIGGDEFCIFMSGNITQNLVKEKCEQLRRVHTVSEYDDYVFVTLSIGVVLSKEYAKFEDLYKMADEALYKAKQNGFNGYHIHMIS